MKVLYVVQRYGDDVAGGAEEHCRQFATRLADRGHDIEVVTTQARSYVDWANHYPGGTTEIDGVTVHRLGVAMERDVARFGALDARITSRGYTPAWLEREWMRLQGPYVPELPSWLEREAGRFDIVSFVTYLYFTTWAGLPAVASRVPTVLHPTAHDEAYLYLRLFDRMFALPSGFAFLTPEEEALVRRRFRTRAPGVVVGVGQDLDDALSIAGPPDPSAFRAAFGLDDRPYLLYLGRFDSAKGADELLAYFVALKERQPGPLALVVVGQAVVEPPPHPDIVVTGYVEEAMKQHAVAGATALVQPSYFESFSIVLLEAWAHRTPVLVQGRCDVLAGQARRSGGGLPYEGFAEFEAAVEMLCSDESLRRRLGEAGREYAAVAYRWEAVIERYERFLAEIAA